MKLEQWIMKAMTYSRAIKNIIKRKRRVITWNWSNSIKNAWTNGQVGEWSREFTQSVPPFYRQSLIFHIIRDVREVSAKSRTPCVCMWPTNHSSLPSLRCRHQMQELPLHSTHSFLRFLITQFILWHRLWIFGERERAAMDVLCSAREGDRYKKNIERYSLLTAF